MERQFRHHIQFIVRIYLINMLSLFNPSFCWYKISADGKNTIPIHELQGHIHHTANSISVWFQFSLSSCPCFKSRSAMKFLDNLSGHFRLRHLIHVKHDWLRKKDGTQALQFPIQNNACWWTPTSAVTFGLIKSNMLKQRVPDMHVQNFGYLVLAASCSFISFHSNKKIWEYKYKIWQFSVFRMKIILTEIY